MCLCSQKGKGSQSPCASPTTIPVTTVSLAAAVCPVKPLILTASPSTSVGSVGVGPHLTISAVISNPNISAGGQKHQMTQICIYVNFQLAEMFSCHTATRSQLTDLATAINNSSIDNSELLTVSTTGGEMDISSNLRLHSAITPEALTSLPPLSTTSTLESVLNEPLMTTASSDTTNKIDIIS